MKDYQKSLCLGVAVLVYSLPVSAAEYSIDASLMPTFTYEDNVRLQTKNQKSSFYTTVSPTLELGRRDDNSILGFKAGYNIERYASVSELDREDPFANITTQYLTERSRYGLTASYTESSQRSIAEDDAGDFSSNATVVSKSIAPTYQYQLSPRDFIYANLSYLERTYSNTGGEVGRLRNLSDNDMASVSAGWYRNLSERWSSGIMFGYSKYESESDVIKSEYDSYNLNLTSEYAISEYWAVSGSVGYRSTDSTTERLFEGKLSDTSTGTLFDISLKYKGEFDDATISLSRSLQPSGEGVVNETDRFGVQWSHRLTEFVSLAVGGSYQESSSTGRSINNDRKYYIFSPTINWRLQENLSLSFGYRYRKQNGTALDNALEYKDVSVDSNMAFMRINYDWDGIRFSR